jgi:hypothetical protein
LAEQAAEIAAVVTPADKPARPDVLVSLDGRQVVALDEYNAMLDRAARIFGEDREGSVWDRFAEVLMLLGQRAGRKDPPPPAGFSRASAAPLPVRMLFAATLQPDIVPADLVGQMGLFGKLTLIPKLIALASLSGAYASRLLGRNVRVDEVIRHPIDPGLDAEATELLVRYFRSRLWARTLVGTRLSIVAGIHQHILDFNAIMFFARAEAQHAGASRLTPELIRRGLTLVEMHLANQPRLYDQVLKGWLRAQLNDLGTAWQSLRLVAPCGDVELPLTNGKSGRAMDAASVS